MSAGEQQRAPLGAGEQLLQGAGRIGIEEGFATGAQVLLEVVEHQQQGLLLEQLLHQPRPQPLVEVVTQQQIGQRPGARAAPLLQRQAQLQADRPQVETTAVAGDHPALFRQPLHQTARHTALAHPADAAQQHTAGRLGVAQAPQTGAQLPAPPHQVADRQLGHRPQQLAHRWLAQRLLVEPEIGQGLLLAGAVQGRGGRLRQDFGARGALGQAPLPLRLQLTPRRRQGSTRQHRFAAAELAIEAAGQLAGIAVAHRGLHRHHTGDAGLDQGLGQAGRGADLHAAMAAVEHHQREGPPERPQRGHQIFRCGEHGAAEFILKLQAARGAMATQVQHVIGIDGNRGSDLLGVPHLQNFDGHVVEPLGRLHRIEDVLKLALVIEHRRAAETLIRGTHRHQHLQWPRQRGRRWRGRGGQATPQHHRRLDRQQPPIRQPQGLKRQPQQLRIRRLDLHQHRGAQGGAIQQLHQGFGGSRRQAEGRQGLTQGQQLRLHAGPAAAGPIAGAGPEAPQKRPAPLAHRCRQLGVLRFEQSPFANPRLHRHAPITAALQPQPHPLLAPRGRRAQRRRAGAPLQQGGGDALVVLDAQATEGPEQRRDVGVVSNLHRQQRLAVLDPLVGEAAYLRIDPRALQRLGRKHDQPGIGLLQAFVHAGNDVVARADLPLVEPGVDSPLAQKARQRLNSGLVAAGMAEEDPHHRHDPWSSRQ